MAAPSRKTGVLRHEDEQARPVGGLKAVMLQLAEPKTAEPQKHKLDSRVRG